MDKEKRLAAARKKLQDYKKARGESASVSGTGGAVETAPVISGNSSSSGSDSSMIIINPQYILENNGNNFGNVVTGTQESDLEILPTPTPSPSLLNDDSKVASQQQSSASSSFADEHSAGGNLINQSENTTEETQGISGQGCQGTTYGAPHSTTSSVPDSDNEQFVFLNPPPGQEIQDIPLYSPQSVSPTGIQLPQLYPPSYGTREPTDSLEMHTFAHNYNQPIQQGQGYSSSSFTPVSGSERFHSPEAGIPMHPVPLNQNDNEQSLIQVPPQPIFIDPNPKVNPPFLPVTNVNTPPLPRTSSEIQNNTQPPVYLPYFHDQATHPQQAISDPLTVNNPYFYPQQQQEEGSSIVLHQATPQVQFADIHPQVNSRPHSRRSNRSQDDDKNDKDNNIIELQRMKSVQDALELQMEELSRDNTRLLNRQSELLAQMEENEKTVQELRRERDHCKEDAKKSLQPLHAKINTLYEENQRVLKSSSDQYNQLMGKVEEKTKQFLEMEQAFIVVSQSKMEFAAQLDQEKEKLKESEINVASKEEEIRLLKEANAKLEERLKVELQKDAVTHQLEDQRRHFQVLAETLQGELERAKERLRSFEKTERESAANGQQNQNVPPPAHSHDHESHSDHHHHPEEIVSEEHQHSASCDHEHGTGDHSEDHEHHHHDEEDHHEHSHDHHGHSHDHHGHSHDHHGHSHSHEESHSHDQEDHHHETEPSSLTSKRSKPFSLQEELTELKKTLLRMEWENTTYRTELDRLAIDAKAKQAYENNYNLLKADSDKMKEEIARLEHLVIQLQGENDTIGDYISLYQSQRLALRERAKEKDAQIENLAKEREVLLSKMAELNELLKELKIPHSLNICGTENVAQTYHHHHQEHVSPLPLQQQQQIEGKIINLISEISSSSLIENFHPCAVCSGRLMTV